MGAAAVLGRRTLVVRGAQADGEAWQVRVCLPSVREAALWAALLSSLGPKGADGDSHESRMLKFEKSRSARERGKMAAKAQADLNNLHAYMREHVLSWAVNRWRKQLQLAAYQRWREAFAERRRVLRVLARCNSRREFNMKLVVFDAWASHLARKLTAVADAAPPQGAPPVQVAVPPPADGRKSADELLELLSGVLSGRYSTSLARSTFSRWSAEVVSAHQRRKVAGLLGRKLGIDTLAVYFSGWRSAANEQHRHRTLLDLWLGSPDVTPSSPKRSPVSAAVSPAMRSPVIAVASPPATEQSPGSPSAEEAEHFYWARTPSPLKALIASPYARPPSRTPDVASPGGIGVDDTNNGAA